MDLNNWNIKTINGDLLVSTQIAMPSDSARSSMVYFEMQAANNVKVGDLLWIESAIGVPRYKVKVTGMPRNPDDEALVQVQTEIQLV